MKGKMRKVERLLAVMMAVLLVTGSLQVSVFAGQAEVPEQVLETVTEGAVNAAEALEEEKLYAEEYAQSAGEEEEASEDGEEHASGEEESGEEDESANAQEESEEDPDEQDSAVEEISEEAEDTSGDEEISDDGQSSEEVKEDSGNKEEVSKEAGEASEDTEGVYEDAEEASGDAQEVSEDDISKGDISEDDISGDGISEDDISEGDISGDGKGASEDEAEVDGARFLDEDDADGQEPAAGAEDDAAAEDSGESAVTEDDAGESGVPGEGAGELPPLEEDGMQEQVLEEAVDAGGAAISVDAHSQSEIRNFIKNHPAPQVDNTYAVTPSAQAPYVAGELSDESKEYAFNALNQMRYIAGVTADVTEKDEYTEKAQAASLVNAANDDLTHYPEKPSGMDDDLYQLGYAGAQSSNIAWGSMNVPHSGAQSIVHSILGWMSDSDSSNIDVVGHRRWIINPDMKYAGFGEAEGYSAVYAHDMSRGDTSYYGVAWPAQNMPLEYFNNDDAWSVSFGMVLTESAVSVNLKRTGDGREWIFSSGGQSDGFFNVENNNYGQEGCVIFRPDSISYSAGDQFTVTISGVGSAPVTYTVEFFKICSGSHDYETLRVLEPTCTEQGETTYVCKNCGDVQYSYVAANGHNYQQNGEMQNGLVTMTCETCGDVKTGSVPSSFTAYWNKEESGSYSSNVPSGVERGDTVYYWIYEKGITYTAESEDHFDDFVVEADGPEGCEVSRESETTGSIYFSEAGSYHLRIYPKYNPGVARTAEIRVVKALESVTLTVSGSQHSQYWYGDSIQLRALANGGKGTLKYTLYLLKDDGTEKALGTVDSTSATGTFAPKSVGLHRLRMDVKDTGDGNRIVSSNILELDIQKGHVIVKNGKTISAAGPLTYGQPLSELTVNNAVFVSSGSSGSGTELSGTFAFNTPDLVLPVGTHTVGWTFTPDDENYETCGGSLRVTVEKAQYPEETPPTEISVPFSTETVSDQILRDRNIENWVFAEEEQNRALAIGEPVALSVIYTGEDAGNYENVTLQITVTRSSCDHDGGTVIRNAKEATCTEDGATGDIYCSLCDELLSSSTVIPAKGHSYGDWSVVNAPTCTEAGSQKKVCAACGNEVIEEISATGHSYGDWNVVNAPTCTEAGSQKKVCTACGDEVVEEIPATGHSYGDWSVVKAATCTEAGSQKKVCTACGNEVVEEIPATGHAYGDWSVVNAATCTEAGNRKKVCTACGDESFEEIPATGHTWEEDYTIDKAPTCAEEGSESIHCSVCGESKEGSAQAIEKLAHTYGDWEITKAATCTEAGSQKKVCTACGNEVDEEIPATGHSYGDWQVTKAATCTDAGSRKKVCAACGNEITEEIPASGHSWGEWTTVKEATEEENGLQERVCDNDSSHKETRTIEKLTHTHVAEKVEEKAPTCTETGNIEYYECIKCHKLFSDEYCTQEITAEETVVPAAGHTWEEDYTVDMAPTCAEEGSESIHCSACGESKEGSARAIEKTAHTYGDWQITKAATCMEAGSRKKVCTVCGDEIVEEIPTTAHTYGDWQITKAATCTEAGSQKKVCTTCGDEVVEEIPTTAHTYGDWEVTKAATCTEAGSRKKVCSACRDEVVETIPATDHTYGSWSVVKAATCTETGSRKKVCEACGNTVTETLSAKGHTWETEYTVDKAPTYTEEGTESIHCSVCGAVKEGSERTISKLSKPVSMLTISGIKTKTYNGKAQTQALVVKDGNVTLTKGTHYTVTYKNNTYAGTASVVITGKGIYTGSLTKTFTIKKAVNKITAKNLVKTYSTKAQAFALGAKISNGTPSYKSSSKSITISKAGKAKVKARFIGKATITITAPGNKNYTKSTKKIMITVNPTKTALSSVSSPSSRKMTVRWKKNAVGTGYQIQYSTSSKFTGAKSALITKNTVLSKTITGLIKGRKYYVRIRTYKTVGTVKYYSGWSAAKQVLIKK